MLLSVNTHPRFLPRAYAGNYQMLVAFRHFRHRRAIPETAQGRRTSSIRRFTRYTSGLLSREGSSHSLFRLLPAAFTLKWPLRASPQILPQLHPVLPDVVRTA